MSPKTIKLPEFYKKNEGIYPPPPPPQKKKRVTLKGTAVPSTISSRYVTQEKKYLGKFNVFYLLVTLFIF